MQQKLIAEAFGTLTLALVVQMSLFQTTLDVITPVLAALVLALFVYTIGSRSGCHINPAVTLGLWSINKISSKDAVYYIIAQVVGAALSVLLFTSIHDAAISYDITPGSWTTFMAEVGGAILFGFGIAAVVYNKVRDGMSGLVIGGSLLLGITIAVGLGSSGILNPAVAFTLGVPNVSYILGSIVGVMLGMNLYRRFIA